MLKFGAAPWALDQLSDIVGPTDLKTQEPDSTKNPNVKKLMVSGVMMENRLRKIFLYLHKKHAKAQVFGKNVIIATYL